jgi:hypothetical protein
MNQQRNGFLRGDHQPMVAKYKEQGKFNFLGGPPLRINFLAVWPLKKLKSIKKISEPPSVYITSTLAATKYLRYSFTRYLAGPVEMIIMVTTGSTGQGRGN